MQRFRILKRSLCCFLSFISADHSLGLIHNGLPVIEWPKEMSELHEEDLLLEATSERTIYLSKSSILLITSQIFSEVNMFLVYLEALGGEGPMANDQ